MKFEDPKIDPLQLARMLWPNVYFYPKQQEVIESVWRDDETIVPAGNMLGKDFVAGAVIVMYFLTHWPCRIVTSSVDDRHLGVLWDEVSRFIQTSKHPLHIKNGGPLIYNHRHIRRNVGGLLDSISYIKGMVPAKGESLQGHHAKYTLWVDDEASGARDEHYDMADTWAKRKLIIGNPWPCENFFKYAVKGRPGTSDKGGDLVDPFSVKVA